MSIVVVTGVVAALVANSVNALPIAFFGNRTQWQYWDSASTPSTDWASVVFDPVGWSNGNAPLGFNNGGVPATNIAAASGITTYYRKGVYLAGVSEFTWTLSGLLDDGAVVYVNGAEAWRFNMPAGAVTASTPALSVVGGANESISRVSGVIPTSMFVEGYNVIAAEVHQAAVDADADALMLLTLLGEPAHATVVNAISKYGSRSLVAAGTSWKYIYNGQVIAGFSTPSYKDTVWPVCCSFVPSPRAASCGMTFVMFMAPGECRRARRP
jgi:hypothetical protein